MTAVRKRHHRPASLALRWTRLARLAWHLSRSLWIAAFRYDRLSAAGQRAAMRAWARDSLRILGVRVRTRGMPHPLPRRCLVVCNHISWLDIQVLDSVCPATFVAKSELRDWPLVGWLCAKAGTLFIERGRRGSAQRVNAVVSTALTEGTLVCIFPEGTTTTGRELGRFHAALFQPAIEAQAVIQPVALRYTERNGQYSAAPNYVGDTSLMSSLWSLTSARRVVAELVFLEPISTAGRDRRELARAAESAIAGALGVTVQRSGRGRHSPPETAGGLPGGLQ